MLSRETARDVAFLAHINLSEEELDRYASQLDRILEFFNVLDSLDIGEVLPAVHTMDIAGPQREDQIEPSSHRQDIMGNTAHGYHGFYQVPRVIE